MPAIVRLSKRELSDLIDSTEAAGCDTTCLSGLLAEVEEEEKPRKPAHRQAISVVPREEETTEERLNREVGYLFPEGITGEILEKCIEMDGKYTLKELRDMCREAGLSPGGEKKELAAKLIAKGVL